MEARSTSVRENYDGYPLQSGLTHGVLSAAAGVDLECKQFICHVDYVLVPEVVGGDVYDLWTFGEMVAELTAL